MIKAFKHLSWFFKENWYKYLICGVALLIVSVFPVIPGKILGMAIDELAMGTLTQSKFGMNGIKWILIHSIPFSAYSVC